MATSRDFKSIRDPVSVGSFFYAEHTTLSAYYYANRNSDRQRAADEGARVIGVSLGLKTIECGEAVLYLNCLHRGE